LDDNGTGPVAVAGGGIVTDVVAGRADGITVVPLPVNGARLCGLAESMPDVLRKRRTNLTPEMQSA